MDNRGADRVMDFHGIVRLLCLLGVCVGLAGCASGPDDQDRAWSDEGRELFGGTAGQPGGSSDGVFEEDGWAILLSFVSGEDHVARAERARGALAVEFGRSDLSVRERRSGSAVVLGSYPDPQDARARDDLAWVQSLRTPRGTARFPRAYLAPPRQRDAGRLPEFDLAGVRELRGPSALYTLQVAVFDMRDRERAKRAAEAETQRLRRSGEEAFYFHGSSLSMVTIGVFGDEAFDARTRALSTRVRALQQRYPFNLMNGEDRIIGPDGRAQPSSLVRIPE